MLRLVLDTKIVCHLKAHCGPWKHAVPLQGVQCLQGNAQPESLNTYGGAQKVQANPAV